MSAGASSSRSRRRSRARRAPSCCDAFARVEELRITTKSTATDLVSEADVAAEQLIREHLAAARPDDGMMGEEGSDVAGTSGLRWVVDPLDGTVNFLFGIPQWCVSVAVEDAAGVLAGVVYDAPRDELWAATRDGEATLDGVPFAAPRAAGPGHGAWWLRASATTPPCARSRRACSAGLLPRVRDVRRLGSAALDLVWTAAGRYDAYFERGLNHWDVAAGELICVRAGLPSCRCRPRRRAARGCSWPPRRSPRRCGRCVPAD